VGIGPAALPRGHMLATREASIVVGLVGLSAISRFNMLYILYILWCDLYVRYSVGKSARGTSHDRGGHEATQVAEFVFLWQHFGKRGVEQ
jgi:hypothetical protein